MPLQLTTKQRSAIEAPLGPVLVVAGPGAGKTFCLIGRIGYLVAKLGFAAERICAVTFTNRAAEEIATRLDDTLGRKAADVHRGTIHALCADILREHPLPAGLTPGFGIADEDYQRTLLRQLKQGPRAGQLLGLFCRHRLEGRPLTPGDAAIFAEYQRKMRGRNIVDFDDLLVRTRDLFLTHPDIAAKVAGRWDYLLVDEFQDVNAAQYAILRRLAEPHRNIFAVGDDEQSIFSWTGADPRVLQRFQTDYGITSTIVLDRNHRTAQQIFHVARRLLEENPSLFEKELSAPRLGDFAVMAHAFADDEEEAQWVITDIRRDRDQHFPGDAEQNSGWGHYAVLYRKHELGNRLEAAFIKAGMPCRLAKGRPLSEDRVIGHVIAALHLVNDPRDSTAAEKYAARVLPPHLMQRVEAEVSGEDDFLLAVRDLAGSMPQGDPDTKKLWQLVYSVENLAAMGRKHATLQGLVDELLTMRSGPFSNVLENHHEDLADPAALPSAQALAERLGRARDTRARVVLEPMNGLEIALRAMLFGAGFKLAVTASEIVQAELDDLRIGPDDAGPDGLAYTVFKALQLVHARALGGAPSRYVTFDLETTGSDTRSCEIVEIGAVRVVDGVTHEEYHELVRPGVPIEPGAQKQHGYSDDDVAGAPPFAEVWPRFKAFVGADALVAHNGLEFDVPVLRRMAAGQGHTAPLHAYDTLPLAKSLGGGSARLTSLAERHGIPVGRAHHALDDARMLVGVYQALEAARLVRARKASLVSVLAWLGVALALDGGRRDTDEITLLFHEGSKRALGRYSDALEVYDAERRRLGLRSVTLEELIGRLGGQRRMDSLREERDAASLYPQAVARLESLVEQHPNEPLEPALVRFLQRVALSRNDGSEAEEHRVNLLTLHSTKGLEFSRVYIVGVEDEQLPGWIGRDEEPEQARQEARRLLYVGMTRARERLVLTRADRRGGKPGGGSRFLDEMQLVIERPLLSAAGEPGA